MDVIDLRTPAPSTAATAGFDADSPSGAAAAYAILAFFGCCFGVVAGAVIF